MVIFFDRYTDNIKKLQETMQYIDFEADIVVLEDNGFLPEGVLTPYEFFIYRQNREALEEKDLHYNFVNVPEFWEIRAVGKHGAIYNMDCKKADIYFAKATNVQRIEWYIGEAQVYKIDYYNKYALKYASKFLDIDGNVESKVFYSDRNQEVIVEQPQNNIITLLENGKVKALFTSYTEFIEYFFEQTSPREKHILFAQDQNGLRLSDLKSDGKGIWEYILFSNNDLLNQYTNMGGKNGRRFYFIPKEYPSNNAKGEVLILTCSDQLEEIEYLIHELSEVIFHIAANTQVSDKLYKLGECQNVRIYPQISMQELNALWDKCDFYFDINHYREIYDAIDVAHQKNLLIMGFENTMHCRELVIEECFFSRMDKRRFVSEVKKLVNQPGLIQGHLAKQQKKARFESNWLAL